jgi:hypothetical protein
VKYCRTPIAGGASAIGFVVSMTVLPVRLAMPAAFTAASAAVPLVARTTISPNVAAPSNEPTFAFPFVLDVKSSRLLGVFVPIVTS